MGMVMTFPSLSIMFIPKTFPSISNKGLPDIVSFSKIFVSILFSSKFLIIPSFTTSPGLAIFCLLKIIPTKKTLSPNFNFSRLAKPTVGKLVFSSFIRAKFSFESLFKIWKETCSPSTKKLKVEPEGTNSAKVITKPSAVKIRPEPSKICPP